MKSAASSRQNVAGQRLDTFKAVLRRHGIKLTHQRMTIFQEVTESEAHPGVESVYKAVRKKLPTVSLDTVYRTLWMLKDLGLIDVLNGRDRARFDGNMKPHHHFVCTECGLLRDFYSKELDQLKVPEGIKPLGKGKTVSIEVKGICIRCFQKSAVKSKKRFRGDET